MESSRDNCLIHLLHPHETWLCERILHYGRKQDYTRYTSTLVEAWRASMSGLMTNLGNALEKSDEVLEHHPDQDFTRDSICTFGIRESRKRRQHGIPLSMFLGLFNYYKKSYLDLVDEVVGLESQDKEWGKAYIKRLFDRVEISSRTG